MSEQKPVAIDRDEAYDMLDRLLRNYGGDDYAKYSAALETLYAATPAQAQHARLSDGDIVRHWFATTEEDEIWPSVVKFAHAIAAAVVPPGFVVVKDWQPIETVPKDGTWFLAWRRHGVLPLLLRWDKQYDAAEDQYGDHVYHLTAWMPLPPAAKATK